MRQFKSNQIVKPGFIWIFDYLDKPHTHGQDQSGLNDHPIQESLCVATYTNLLLQAVSPSFLFT